MMKSVIRLILTSIICVNLSLFGAEGDVVTSFPIVGSATPVGIVPDGSGGFYVSDIGTNTISKMDAMGNLGTNFAGVGNEIGLATDGTFLYQTDTTADQVVVFNMAGVIQSSFPIVAHTTFPEGITFNPSTGNLYVVDGSAGGNKVDEFTTAGVHVQSHSVNGSSQDGIAFDPINNVYWIYDSGTDLVRKYDLAFNEISSFAGTINAGFACGEGVAVSGDRLYIVATGSDTVVVFEIEAVVVASSSKKEPVIEMVPVKITVVDQAAIQQTEQKALPMSLSLR